MSFKKLGLTPELLHAITARGYKIATPIQSQSIPPILEGRDVMAGAQTGTGKTAAFALPILQILNAKPKKARNPRALILTPTRELAAQVLEFTKYYGKSLTLRSIAIFGGVDIRPQISKLRQGIDILVATPGRLLDHVSQKTLSLSEIEIIVLDEADRMMDMGFAKDLQRIMNLIPAKRQNLLFSATYSRDIKRLADKMLTNPVLIEVEARNTAAETVAQVVHPVEQREKQKLLSQLIRKGNWKQTLVFTRTKHGANKLVKALLTDNITATAIHGNKSQAARTKALADFKTGKMCVLVATDIAARGLDITLLPHVVNFELPDTPENYIHRIGRTGRAGKEGKAISLVCPLENYELHAIHRLLKHEIPVERIEGFDAELLTTAGQPQSRQRSSRGGNKNQSNRRPRTGSARTGSKRSDAARTGSTRTGSKRPDTARTGSTRTGSKRPDTAKTGSTRTSSAKTGTTKTNSAWSSFIKTKPARTGTEKTGSKRPNATRTGSTRTGSAKTGTTKTKSTWSGFTKTKPIQKGPAKKSSGKTGPTRTATARTETKRPQRPSAPKTAGRRL